MNSSPASRSVRGLSVYRATLRLHDYLWFASAEASAVVHTEAAIHPYALGYALNAFERALDPSVVPHYLEDIPRFGLYPTPARAVPDERWGARRTAHTYNAVDERTLLTDATKGRNEPIFGVKRTIAPWCRFNFYVFAKKGADPPPRAFRLGKKRSPVRLEEFEELAIERLERGRVEPTHLVNPRDLTATVESYRPLAMPPHLLFDDAVLADEWFVRSGSEHRVHVPEWLLEASA